METTSQNISKIVLQILEEPFATKIGKLGGQLFMVGGCVRDSLLGKDPKDIDLVVRNIEFDELVKMLNRFGKVTLTEVGDKFGVIKFLPELSDQDFDIALPRTETLSEIGEGRNAFDVNSNPNLSIEDDLKRRDFTINAIAVNCLNGDIIDPFDGIEDLENGLIRMVNPEAFSDDPLRMLRAIQFVSRFEGFEIEPNTFLEIRKNADSIRTITGERVKDEIEKIFTKGDIKKGLFFLHSSGLRNKLFDFDFSTEFLANSIETEADFWLTVCGSENFKDKLKGDTKMFREIAAIETLLGDFETTPEATLEIANQLKKNSEFINSGILARDSDLSV